MASATSADLMNIAGVQANQMMKLWPHVKDYFRSFEDLSKGELTAGELLTCVIDKKIQCWIATDGDVVKACALTEVIGKTVTLSFCAGRDREEWRDEMVDEITRWAKSIGVNRFRIICRPGWTRELKALGFRETHRILEREI